jgi:hypothetical protein
MERVIVIIIFSLFVSNFSSAQISKNTWLIGGNLNFSNSKNNTEGGSNTKEVELLINPTVGFFVLNKVAFGGKFSIGKKGVKNEASSDYIKYTDFNLGPFIRYYFLPNSPNFNLMLEGAYQYGFIKSGNEVINKNIYSLSAGTIVFFTETVGIEFLVGYSSYKYIDYSGYNSSIKIGLGLMAHFSK